MGAEHGLAHFLADGKVLCPRLIENLREALDDGGPMSPEVGRKVIKLFRQLRPPVRTELISRPTKHGCLSS